MDTPLPWLLAGTAVGLALAFAGRTMHRRVRARRLDAESRASADLRELGAGLTTMMADAPLRHESTRGARARHRSKDPARLAARAAAREKAARVIAAEAERVKALREAEAQRPPHILVVDDSTTIRHATGGLLERQGWRVTYAVDGMEALLRIASELPDAVVTDIEMPRMDGLGLVRRLRADPRTAHLPIVMVSSAEERFRDEALSTGIDALLAKPYDDDALLGPLRRGLHARRLRAD